MRVISGAGEFEISTESLEVRGASLVLTGKMGVWESETFIDPGEMARLVALSARPRIVLWAVRAPFTWLWTRLRRRGDGPAAT